MTNHEQAENETGITLNFLPVKFSNSEVSGFKLPYQDDQQLRYLQDQYHGKFLLKRAGKKINTVPLIPITETLSNDPCVFSARDDWTLFDRLLEEGIRRSLRERNPNMRVPEFGKILIKVEGEKNDLLREALSQEIVRLHARIEEGEKNDLAREALSQLNLALTKLNFIHIYRKYRLSGSHVRRGPEDDPQYGVIIEISTNWQIRASIADLIAKKVNVTGCYRYT